MIICAQCGGRNEDNENFCGVCGSYLEWDGSRVEQPARAGTGGPVATDTTAPAGPPAQAAQAATPSPTPGPSPSPDPTPGPTAAPVANGNGAPPAAPGPQAVAPVNPSVSRPVPPSVTQPAPPPVTGAQVPPAPTVPLQPVPPGPPVPPSGRPATDESAPPPPVTPAPPVPPRAPEMPVVQAQQPGAQRPGAPQRPGERQPAAQRPGAAQTRRRQYVDEAVDEPPPDPGDLICGNCGAGNVPTRKFCRRCGNSLADAPVAGKKSWWRRLMDWIGGDGRRYEAGHRRKVRLPSRFRKLAVLAMVVLVGGFLVLVPGRGPIRSGINMVKDRFSKRVEVTPTRAEASSSAPGSSPQQLIDGVTNTFWAPAARGDSAVGSWVQADFANPVRLLDLLIHPGVAPDRPTFLTEGRPKTVRITVTSENGDVKNKDITLPDVQGSHKFTVKASHAVSVRLTLLSAYGAQVGRVVAVAEVEFFARG